MQGAVLLPEEAVVDVLGAVRTLNPHAQVHPGGGRGGDAMRVAAGQKSVLDQTDRILVGVGKRQFEDPRRTESGGQPDE